MSAQIIDGKAFAAKVRGQVAEHVTRIKEENGITPGLAVVLVGEDPASQVYVRSKGKQTVEAGMNSYEHKLDADTSQGCAWDFGSAALAQTPERRFGDQFNRP
jgi:methylenetetrahydrofolate dehydrogenase (NADP+)/methenyltetrahydrofolate cyclohydrolase